MRARRRVRVQPGVVRNELNLASRRTASSSRPETSTANRAMIGGMVGNNSCGSNSIVYGSTRDHLVSARGFLSDGSEVTFGPLTPREFDAKCAGADTLETRIYRTVRDLLGDAKNRAAHPRHFPEGDGHAAQHRLRARPADGLRGVRSGVGQALQPLPAARRLRGHAVSRRGVRAQLRAAAAAGRADVRALSTASRIRCRPRSSRMRHRPFGCELIDRHILECTKTNLEQAKNRFFVQGDPGAVLVVEIRHDDRAQIEREMAALEARVARRRARLRLSRAVGRRRQPRLGPAPRRPGPDEQCRRRRQAARGGRGHRRRGGGSAGVHRGVRRADARTNTASAASTTRMPAPASCTRGRCST